MKKVIGGVLVFVIGAIIAFFMIVIAFVFMGSSFFMVMTNDDNEDVTTHTGMVCSPSQEINEELWSDNFSRAGAFENKGNKIIEVSRDKGLDPVLFASIAFFETGWGTSRAVKEFNNPGGLMDPKTGSKKLYKFDTLDEGIEAMGNTLYNRIIVDGLTTIEELGAIYAPIGASNDPDNLNANWVPGVSNISAKLGGLIMNCDYGDFAEIIGEYSWIVPHTKRITSYYGARDIKGCSTCSSFHNGIDISDAGINRTPVLALAEGEVIVSSSLGTTWVSPRNGKQGKGFGYYVVIDHGGGVESVYAHLYKPGIKKGTQVTRGQPIGAVGSTGASTGPHLHFEIRIDGKAVDPMQMLGDFLE